jgi:hypothetical protein
MSRNQFNFYDSINSTRKYQEFFSEFFNDFFLFNPEMTRENLIKMQELKIFLGKLVNRWRFDLCKKKNL